MNPYAFLVRHLPRPLVDAGFVLAQAGLLVLIVLYSDKHAAAFPYLKL
jgi:hypothetical protein